MHRGFDKVTVFTVTFCSLICHPVSVALFFYCAYTATMPPVHVFIVVALGYVLSYSGRLRSLKSIDTWSLCKKSWRKSLGEL